MTPNGDPIFSAPLTRPDEPPPLLSIITPVYNGLSLLPRFLASLARIAPDHRPWVQIIFIDDGSTDSSPHWLNQQLARLSPLRILVLHQPHSGPAATRNLGLDRASGNWIMFLDHDDELAADPVPLIRQHEQASAILLPVQYHRQGRSPSTRQPPRITAANHLDRFTAGNPLPICSILFRRSAIQHRMNPTLRFGEDWLFWACNTAIFQHAQVLSGPVLATVHLHGGNTSGNYAAAGVGREAAAGLMLDMLGNQLTDKQRRNLSIQQTIGRLQQGLPVDGSALTKLPCNLGLYAKLWVYSLSRLLGQRPTLYRPR